MVSPTANWRAFCCAIRVEDKECKKPLEDQQDESIERNKDVENLIDDSGI
jgi:hypothetical protein